MKLTDADVERIYARCDQQGECRIWKLSCGSRGLWPQVKVRGHVVSARRALAEWSGMDLDGQRVRLSCGSARCLAIGHFIAASQSEIARHNGITGRLSTEKRRAAARRAGRERSSLTPADVRTIYASTDSITALAKRYGKSRRLILKIRARQVWTDVLSHDVTRPDPKRPAEPPPAMFSALRIGCYAPSDSAIARAYR